MSQRIWTKCNNKHYKLEIGGWFSGTGTYLWFGIDGSCVGVLYGPKLYRLARAVVKQFETDRAKRAGAVTR